MRFIYIVVLSFIFLLTGCSQQEITNNNEQILDKEVEQEDSKNNTNDVVEYKVLIKIKDLASDKQKEYLVTNKVTVHPVLHPVFFSNSKDNYIIIYGEDDHILINIDKQEEKKISVSAIEGNNFYDNWLRFDELYSNRFYDSYTYMVKGHRDVYKVDLKDMDLIKIYEAPLAIYGITSSPKGDKIAILYSHDDYIGPDADLIILNQEGEEELFIEKATRKDHSDGVIAGFYPMFWKNDNEILLGISPTEDNLDRMKSLDLETGEFTNYITNKNNLEIENKILKHEETSYFYQIYWSLDKSKVAYNTSNKIWIYDIREDKYIYVGEGKIIYWMDNDKLVWYES